MTPAERHATPTTRSGYQDTHLPHRLVMNGIWELPFGQGRRFASDANPVVNAIIGNWSVSAIWNWQSGRPNLTMGNVYYDGDITQLKTNYTNDPDVSRCSTPAGSTSTMRRCRPTAWTIRRSSAPTRASS